MRPYILECCVDSVSSAIEAQAGGAHRLELCSNLIIGGSTPTLALYKEVRKHTSLPIHVLIRPRFGDFLYSELESTVIIEEILQFKEAGADGIVIGSLTPEGFLHTEMLRTFIAYAGSMHLTLHRAFDMCADPFRALDEALELGFHTILTSGQADSWKQGLSLLKQLDSRCADTPLQIMAGSGINASAIKQLLTETNLHCFHMSGKKVLESNMIYRNPLVHMGIPGFSEYQLLLTDRMEIAAARTVLPVTDDK